MNRHRAAAIHLCLSILVVGSVLAAALLQWYPGIWFESMGGKHLILILAGVDIAIGPLLTWIVFRPGKKELKFDLTVIATLQLLALLYGAYTLFVARPVYMVLVADQFRTVTAIEIDPALLAQSEHPELRELPLDGPRVAGSFLPSDPREREILKNFSVMQGADLHQLPQYWKPYKGIDALRVARKLAELRALAPDNPALIDAFLQQQGRPEDSLRFLPLRTRHKEMAALIDASNGAVVGIIDARPWR